MLSIVHSHAPATIGSPSAIIQSKAAALVAVRVPARAGAAVDRRQSIATDAVPVHLGEVREPVAEEGGVWVVADQVPLVCLELGAEDENYAELCRTTAALFSAFDAPTKFSTIRPYIYFNIREK